MRQVLHPSGEVVTLYDSLEELLVSAADAIAPKERLSVSQAAARYHIVSRPPVHDGPFDLDRAPYLVEPMDTLTSLDHTGWVFVAPARTGKSASLLNWLAHTSLTDPTNMRFVHMAQHTAREWSLDDLAKMLRDSPDIAARLVPGRQNDNVFDKAFLSGMRFTLLWPTAKNLAGWTARYVGALDYDRNEDDIDGEGDLWTQLKKRTQTYGRYGMCAVESSPGKPVEDPQWMPTSPHEPPPAKGLLSIYSESDRRRWYWECPQCHGSFEPHRKLLNYPDSNDPMECAEQVTLGCPHCGFPMTPDMQRDLNRGGRWVKEGQLWVPGAREPLVGTPRRSPIAGFWMFGPAAAFTDWKELVYKLRAAETKFDTTGDEGPLQVVINTDFGEPYTPKALQDGRLPEDLKNRAKPYAAKGEVPPGVAFLVTTIDVQGGALPNFVCHTFGIAPVQVGDTWMLDIYHVDMWKIRKSPIRKDEDGESKPIDPAAYKEDWHVLIPEVLERTYPLADGSGRMAVKLVACDSGGAPSKADERKNKNVKGQPKVSVTSNAYDFWRYLKKDPEGRGHHMRFHLVKGVGKESAPMIHRSLPDSQQKDKFAIARGDVPVWLLNSDKGKDQVFNMLGRTEPGGQIHCPVWYEDDGETPMDIGWLFSQLTTEVRTSSGWTNPSRRKNEAFDLLYYCVLMLKHPDIRAEFINWSQPPGWAQTDWSKNDLVLTEDRRPFAPAPKSAERSLRDLADKLG